MNKYVLVSLLLLFVSNSSFSQIHDSIFRQYDIRGIVGAEFQITDAYNIGRSIATYFSRSNNSIKKVIVGADARVHSPAITQLVVQALRESGYDVISIGTCATPVLYFTLHTQQVDAGVMITASHNPGEYNGFKICIGKQSLYGPHIQELKHIIETDSFMPAHEQGSYSELDANSLYLDYLVDAFAHLKNNQMPVVIDCGNGAAGTIIPQLIERMGWSNACVMYAELDGTYPHHIADPTVEANMIDLKHEVIKTNAVVGIGFDGDVDRMAPVTSSGRLIKGDMLLTIHAHHLLEKNPGATFVCDVTSSKALYDAVMQWGGNMVMSQTGAVFVKQAIAQHNAILGGEISCHTVFADRYLGFDDGFYSMMRLVELLHESCQSLDELLETIPSLVSSPTYRIPCARAECDQIVQAIVEHYKSRDDAHLITIDGVRIHLPNGWAIVRASNTEPLISIRVEGADEQSLQLIKDELNQIMQPIASTIRL